MPPNIWDDAKNFLMGGGALKKAAATGDTGNGSGVQGSPNTMAGSDPSYTMKQTMENAQDNANRQLAAEKAARSQKGTSAPVPGKTPITVKSKGATGKSVDPMSIMAAPRGK
jgi:hypothetical protein